jgi:hypothetical protein
LHLTDAIIPALVLGGILVALFALDRFITNHTRRKDQ